MLVNSLYSLMLENLGRVVLHRLLGPTSLLLQLLHCTRRSRHDGSCSVCLSCALRHARPSLRHLDVSWSHPSCDCWWNLLLSHCLADGSSRPAV
jgi:hypothetical protein